MLETLPVVVHQDSHVTISSWHSLLVYVYFEPMKTEHIAIGRRLHREQLKRVGKPFPVALFFRTNRLDTGNTEAIRDEMAILVREASHAVAVCTVVLESTGFVASALRSVATAIMLIARPAFPLKFVDAAADCAPLILPAMSDVPGMNLARLSAALTKLRDPPHSR